MEDLSATERVIWSIEERVERVKSGVSRRREVITFIAATI